MKSNDLEEALEASEGEETITEEFQDPVVVEQADLEDLRLTAEEAERDYDQLRESVEDLQGPQDRVEELEEHIERLQHQADAVEVVKREYASELSESGVLDTEDYLHLDVATLQEKVSDLEHSTEVGREDPAPKGASLSEEELDKAHGVENQPDAEIEELREKASQYEEMGWDKNAEKVRSEIAELSG
jgi:DNA repair exonuclease SbcCD ATPase subunit